MTDYTYFMDAAESNDKYARAPNSFPLPYCEGLVLCRLPTYCMFVRFTYAALV